MLASTTLLIIFRTTTPSQTAIFPTPIGCIGATYSIKSGDTCQTISLSQGISTSSLLLANNLSPFCVNFPSSGSLCIPNSSKCKTAVVKSGDTCAKIGANNKATWTQITTWNPDFGADCGRISSYVGYSMCISTPGGDWSNPSPTPSRTRSTTRYLLSRETIILKHASLLTDQPV